MSQARPLSPGAERRRQLRLQQRQESLRNAWRVLVFLGLAGGLGYGLLRLGWTLSGPEQVEVIGSRQVTTTEVISAADIRFPQPLLTLDPRRIASGLAGTLPVEEVRVSRLMALRGYGWWWWIANRWPGPNGSAPRGRSRAMWIGWATG